jgi:hypothetical protein
VFSHNPRRNTRRIERAEQDDIAHTTTVFSPCNTMQYIPILIFIYNRLD